MMHHILIFNHRGHCNDVVIPISWEVKGHTKIVRLKVGYWCIWKSNGNILHLCSIKKKTSNNKCREYKYYQKIYFNLLFINFTDQDSWLHRIWSFQVHNSATYSSVCTSHCRGAHKLLKNSHQKVFWINSLVLSAFKNF